MRAQAAHTHIPRQDIHDHLTHDEQQSGAVPLTLFEYSPALDCKTFEDSLNNTSFDIAVKPSEWANDQKNAPSFLALTACQTNANKRPTYCRSEQQTITTLVATEFDLDVLALMTTCSVVAFGLLQKTELVSATQCLSKTAHLHGVVLGSTHQPWPPSHGGLAGFRRGVRAQFCCVELLRLALAIGAGRVMCCSKRPQKLEADISFELSLNFFLMDEQL